jgi:hypothetical protein
LKVFRRILRDDEDAAALWSEALAVERDAILAKMYQLAQEGDTKAATFMLAARHNMRERGDEGGDSGARVVISLPGSMSEAQYRRIIQAGPALEGGADG